MTNLRKDKSSQRPREPASIRRRGLRVTRMRRGREGGRERRGKGQERHTVSYCEQETKMQQLNERKMRKFSTFYSKFASSHSNKLLLTY